MKLSANDIEGIVGIVPTPTVANGQHWSVRDSVDIEETARMTALVRDAGIRIVLTNGTFGEGASLLKEEQRDFVACIAQTMKGRGLVFAGVTTLNTRATIDRARSVLDAGADGLFLGRPMWLSVDQADIVRYYADIAEALPGIPLITYDNPLAFKGGISAQAYAELARNPAIVAAKHPGSPEFGEAVAAVGGRIRMLPSETRWHSWARRNPDEIKACWAGSVACAPEALVALAAAIASRDWETAAPMAERMAWAEEPMFPDGSLEKFMDYSIQIAHARFAAAGLIVPGPSRAPYLSAPEAYLEGARESGRRWRLLREEFAARKNVAA